VITNPVAIIGRIVSAIMRSVKRDRILFSISFLHEHSPACLMRGFVCGY
jgi:hypothetical protein